MFVYTSFRKRFRNHQLRHVNFVLQEIGYGLLGVADTPESQPRLNRDNST